MKAHHTTKAGPEPSSPDCMRVCMKLHTFPDLINLPLKASTQYPVHLCKSNTFNKACCLSTGHGHQPCPGFYTSEALWVIL